MIYMVVDIPNFLRREQTNKKTKNQDRTCGESSEVRDERGEERKGTPHDERRRHHQHQQQQNNANEKVAHAFLSLRAFD